MALRPTFPGVDRTGRPPLTTSGNTSTTLLPSGMTGIGNDHAARIAYRALATYMTSSTNYAGARTAYINAAKDLYGAGSAEEAAVWNAYHGINVGAAWTGSATAPSITGQPRSLTVHAGARTSHTLTARPASDVSNPSTVIGAVGAARENARSVRDALSGDVFEALNGAYLTLSRGLTTAASPGASMHRVLERLMVVNGAVEWTMSRDEGHYFLTLGRSLERIDMTARLLDVRHDLLWPDTGAPPVLPSPAAPSSTASTWTSSAHKATPPPAAP